MIKINRNLLFYISIGIVIVFAIGASVQLWNKHKAIRIAKADAEAVKLYIEMRRWDDVARASFAKLESKRLVPPSGMNEDLLKEIEAARYSAKSYTESVDRMMEHFERHKDLFRGTYNEGVTKAFRIFWGSPEYVRQQQAHIEHLDAYVEVVRYKVEHEREIGAKSPDIVAEFGKRLVDYQWRRKEAVNLEDRWMDMLQRAISENPDIGGFIEGLQRIGIGERMKKPGRKI